MDIIILGVDPAQNRYTQSGRDQYPNNFRSKSFKFDREFTNRFVGFPLKTATNN